MNQYLLKIVMQKKNRIIYLAEGNFNSPIEVNKYEVIKHVIEVDSDQLAKDLSQIIIRSYKNTQYLQRKNWEKIIKTELFYCDSDGSVKIADIITAE